jgi:hypothetical protein
VATFLISPLDDNSLMMISDTLAEVAGGFMAFGQASLSVPPQVFKAPLKHPCSKKTFLGKVAGVCSCKYAPISFGFTIHGIPIEKSLLLVTGPYLYTHAP